MGCASSSKKDGDYYNKDIDEKRKLLTGFHMSRGTEGIETNFQVAIWRKSKKHYKKSTVEEKKELEEKYFFPILRANHLPLTYLILSLIGLEPFPRSLTFSQVSSIYATSQRHD